MAVSCPEVMYGAYYPYLYGRGAARSFHHAPHFQYTDRLNVQSGAGNAGSEAYGGGALSSGSASSGGGSPPQGAGAGHHHPRLRAKEEEASAVSRHSADAAGASSESEGECGREVPPACRERARAQYVSANCVVFTHYSGDVAAVVDEHFARALAIDKPKESVPMVSRNLPASFFNAALCGGAGGGGGACGTGGGAGVEVYEYDPWQAHYGSHYAPQYAAAHAHQHMAAAAGGYGGLLLGRGALHAQYKPVEWGAHPSHAHAHHAAAHLDPAVCSPYYPPVPGRPLYQTGLEAQVQDTSKDLYWF